MLKYLLVVSLLISSSVYADIVEHSNVKITEISAYDDYQNGTVYLGISLNSSFCMGGVYLNANTTAGFKNLYALALAAASAGKVVNLQLYNDRIESNRCEVDAIRVQY